MQTFNQTLEQKEANKGSKRPIEDLFSDKEFSSNQKKRHKRSETEQSTNVVERLKPEPRGNSWKIYVPKDAGYFWSIALAYLISVKDKDDFKDRFVKLFGSENLLDETKTLIQSYNPFFNNENIYKNEILKGLVQQFQKEVSERKLSPKDTVELINTRLSCKIVFLDADAEDKNEDESVSLKLFRDTSNHFHFGLKKSIGRRYEQLWNVDQRLEGFVKKFVSVYKRCLSEYDERLEKRIIKNGKWANFFHKIIDTGTGASESGVTGLSKVTSPENQKAAILVLLKVVDNVVSASGDSFNWKELKKLTKPIRACTRSKEYDKMSILCEKYILCEIHTQAI